MTAGASVVAGAETVVFEVALIINDSVVSVTASPPCALFFVAAHKNHIVRLSRYYHLQIVQRTIVLDAFILRSINAAQIPWLLPLGASQDGDTGNGFFDSVETAAIFGDGIARALDLPAAGFAPQLGGEFENLRQTSGADRVALGFEPTRRIDRDFAPERRRPGLGEGATGPEFAKAQILNLLEFGKGGCVMHFGNIYIVRAEPCNFICVSCCASGDVAVEFIWLAVRPAA
jgi:hypothetical protein